MHDLGYLQHGKAGEPMITSGFFVDWNGDTRRVESPGGGYTCRVINRGSYMGVEVIDHAGFVCHEATFFATLAKVEAAGVKVNLT